MVLGIALATFTAVHVVISLVAIATGFIAVFQMLDGRKLGGWNSIFLVATLLTSLTGFLFPFSGFTSAIGVGIISVVVLAVAFVALYVGHPAGSWRWLYVMPRCSHST